jgi:hypothetical protein
MSLAGNIMLAAWAGKFFLPFFPQFLVLMGLQPASRAIFSCTNGRVVQAGVEKDHQSIDVQILIRLFFFRVSSTLRRFFCAVQGIGCL